MRGVHMANGLHGGLIQLLIDLYRLTILLQHDLNHGNLHGLLHTVEGIAHIAHHHRVGLGARNAAPVRCVGGLAQQLQNAQINQRADSRVPPLQVFAFQLETERVAVKAQTGIGFLAEIPHLHDVGRLHLRHHLVGTEIDQIQVQPQ